MGKSEEQFEEEMLDFENTAFDSIVAMETELYNRCESMAVKMHLKTDALIAMMVMNELIELEQEADG